jgi:hypothetical protein
MVRTPQGLVVSGTTVRNRVRITGDEFGEHLKITGEADQKVHDDVTPRYDDSYRSTQFSRRADPHGSSAAKPPTSMPGQGARSWWPLESTDGGLPVTGTAVGRSGRVTGNEAGSCHPITGDQYQNVSSYYSECASSATPVGYPRMDPATLSKVTVAQTWRGKIVTGPSLDHRPNVTGDEPGSCRPVTGTPYQGPTTAYGWCETDQADDLAHRLDPVPPGVAITGDIPMPARSVTGTERGQQRTVTGTPYYVEERAAQAAADDSVCWPNFSVPVSLARRMVGREIPEGDREGAPSPTMAGRVTGSFAVGEGMVTGNNEFLFRPRPRRDGQQPRVTGEGDTRGPTVTGSAWTMDRRVTGTEGYIAARRNPSEAGGEPHGWSGATRFKEKATPGPKDRFHVTGRSGGSPDARARVTLSGGAQG